MEIRLAFPNEVDAIMQVMEDAKKYLAKSGSDQWQNGYPNTNIIIDDIISGQAYVALEEGEPQELCHLPLLRYSLCYIP